MGTHRLEELRNRLHLRLDWDRLGEALGCREALRRLRALRREEAIDRLVAEGWSRPSAEEHLATRAGLVAAFQDRPTTRREAKNRPLGDRKSGRRRARPRPRPPRWWEF